MEYQKDREETIENVISWKHFQNLGSFHCCTVKYPCGKNTQSCTSPDQQKDSKYNITENIKLCIVKHLGQLQEDVGTVVGQ